MNALFNSTSPQTPPPFEPGRKIKVFYVIERLARAGTELHLLHLLERLDRERFEPVLCCLNGALTDVSLVPPGITCHTLDASWNLAHPRAFLLYQRLARLIGAEAPDVVHSFLFVANIMAAYAASSVETPVTVVTRGRMGIEWEATWLHRTLQRAADRRTTATLCKTEAMRHEIHEEESVPLDRIFLVPNGVDIQTYVPPRDAEEVLAARQRLVEKCGIPLDAPLAVAVGNLKPIKGHRFLVEAASILQASRPDLHIAVVGEGESASELRQMVKERHLEKIFHFPGKAFDVRPWMYAATLFVAPSLSEGMPNALLEAMACGLSAVLSDIPGHREAAGVAAWYFEAGRPESLATALEQALADPDTRQEWGQRMRRRTEERFSLDVMVRTTENIYCKLLGDARAAGRFRP
jgi:starch synthase (maltosyl-transferring)